jgi:hypothetical protein
MILRDCASAISDQLFPYLTAVPVGELLEGRSADTPPPRVVGPLKVVVAGTFPDLSVV